MVPLEYSPDLLEVLRHLRITARTMRFGDDEMADQLVERVLKAAIDELEKDKSRHLSEATLLELLQRLGYH